MNPRDHGSEAHGDVHGNNNEPDKGLGHARRQAEEREGKGCLGPHDGGNGDCRPAVDDNHEANGVIDLEVPVVPAVLEVIHQDGGYGGSGDYGTLIRTVSQAHVSTLQLAKKQRGSQVLPCGVPRQLSRSGRPTTGHAGC